MKQSKITFLTSVGAGLEYYDFVIYSLMAGFISQQFFPGHNHVAALFATFMVFALGNIVRPLGGVIFGILGDCFGRKNIFANTLLWMALISLLMGLVPTFATWGLIATFIFGGLRILQGLVFGAEFPGALTLLSEHIDIKRQGVHFGFMISAIGLGVSLGSLVIWSLTKIITEPQMVAWGFRLPFILGGGLALVGFYIRKHVPETPKFLAMKKAKEKPSLGLIKKHGWQILNIIGILLFPSSLVVFKLIFPVYLHDFYKFSMSDIYLAMTFGYIWSAIMLPIFGWLSDYTGKKFLIITASLIMIVFIFPVFALLRTESRWALFVFIIFTQTVTAIMAASYFTLLPQTFKTAIRFTGTAVSHNITHTIAALTPLAVTYFYGVLRNPDYLVWMFILLATLTIVSTIVFKIKSHDEVWQPSDKNTDYVEDMV
ncbi:MAG: MFS transporter [Gammaproteobacteria bacterium]|nr:MFS transporter [Gammaproteobacteria bacterium]